MGVFVHQQQAGAPGDGGVDVEFEEGALLVLQGRPGHDVQAAQQGLGLAAAVGLHDADHHIAALGLTLAGGAQHFVGLAHPRRHAEEYLQPPPPRSGGGGEQGVGVWARGFGGGHPAGG